MNNIRRFGPPSILAIALCVGLTSCNSTQQPSQSATSTDQAPAPNGDPAQANVAPVQQTAANSAPAQQPAANYPAAQQPAPAADNYPPAQQPAANYPAAQQPAPSTAYSNGDQGYSSGDENDAYDTADPDPAEPPVYAAQPPPPLPEYSQPECPGENYEWTPGNWGYAQSGYYWVPGAWVLAPYVGSLWTPPYWGYSGGRYRWYHGYWGAHIGFYGGISYGFGYVGHGYEGGYWHGRDFTYNRTVNNINVTIIHNVYNYRVTNITNTRVSYNGGRGGLNVRPTQAELIVLREPRIAPVPAQVQHMQQASQNRAQFAAVNHGRPQEVAAARPLPTAYRAPAASPRAVPGAREMARVNIPVRPAPAARPAMSAAPHAAPAAPAARPEERMSPHAAPPAPAARPEDRMAPRAVQPAPAARPEERAAPHPAPARPAEHPAPAEKKEPTKGKDAKDTRDREH